VLRWYERADSEPQRGSDHAQAGSARFHFRKRTSLPLDRGSGRSLTLLRPDNLTNQNRTKGCRLGKNDLWRERSIRDRMFLSLGLNNSTRVANLLHAAPDESLAHRVYRENRWLRITPTVVSFLKVTPTESGDFT